MLDISTFACILVIHLGEEYNNNATHYKHITTSIYTRLFGTYYTCTIVFCLLCFGYYIFIYGISIFCSLDYATIKAGR